MIKNIFKTLILRATTDFKRAEPYQSIPLKTSQLRIKQIIEKNQEPSQYRLNQIIIKNKLIRILK